MSDREFENYLALLTGMLRLRRTQREGIAGELRDHLIEHVAQLEASGIKHEEAVRRALEEFGDAAALAANFQALVGMRRRRLVMRCTIGTTVVMTGLVVAMLAFRPQVADDPNLVQAQAEAEQGGTSSTEDRKKTDFGKVRTDPDQRTRQALKSPSSVEFTETPLNVALATLSEQHGVQYYLDKRSLRDSDINQDAPVTLDLEEVPFGMVLDLMLRELGLGYRIRNGVIVVASETDMQSKTEVRVYELPLGGVEEGVSLAHELALLIPATIEIQSWQSHMAPTNVYGDGGFGGAFGGGMGGEMGMGAPETGIGTLRVFRGTLVVSQTPEVHQRIEKLLEDLSNTGALNPQRLEDLRTAQPPASSFGGTPSPGGSFQPAQGPGGYSGRFVPGQPAAGPSSAPAPGAGPGQPSATVPTPAAPSDGTPPATAAPGESKNVGP